MKSIHSILGSVIVLALIGIITGALAGLGVGALTGRPLGQTSATSMQ